MFQQGNDLMQPSIRRPAFTLLEMLAVITIIGILAGLVISRVSVQAFEAKKKCCLQYKGDLNAAIEHFHFEQGTFPNDLSDLQGTYYPESIPQCPVDSAPYVMDPLSHRIQGHDH
jgi:prepilin-type N-terminal cleavage/methylation domain-containing protein